jgi:predicted transposase YbfD/YdcC
MENSNGASIVDHFEELVDPRLGRNRRHDLIDIVVLTVCAVISGAETWEDIEDYGKCKLKWLKRFIELSNGIPSHDTVRRLFIRLDPQSLQQCFFSWVEAVREQTEGDVVAIDGKTLRRSGDAASSKMPIHMVSAWAAANSLVLGRQKTSEHSNEITAIPALLDLLKVKGCIVTIDAEGCQTAIAEKINKEKKADYVLAVKGNQPNLMEQISDFFADTTEADVAEQWLQKHKTVDKGHGRIEVREYYHSDEIAALPRVREFHGAQSIGMVRSKRIIGEKESTQIRYYISSLAMDAEKFAHAVRSHWSVENNLHWTLDMSFREDDSRMRSGYSAENFAMMRRMALSLMKRDTDSKKSLKRRRKICGYADKYLEQLLFNSDQTLARCPPG